MAINPSQQPNPYLAYVWVTINGTEITIPQKGPRRLTSFTYSRIGDKGGNRLSISFFDKDWDVVENPIISSSSLPIISFRYGFTDGLQSPTFNGIIYDYKPVFAIDGTKIIVEAVSTGLSDSTDRIKSRVWANVEIHEIVETIAGEHGWNVDIDKCEAIFDNDDLEGSMVVNKHFRQSKVRDLQFIITVLAPLSIRKRDKAADYKVWLDDVSNTLHFHPPRFEEGETDTFIFMRDKMSEVISFSPDIQGALNLRMGAGVSGVPYIDAQTGQYEDIYHTNETTPEKTLLGGPLTTAGEVINEDYSVVDHRYVRDVTHADIAARDRYFEQFNSIYGATLVIHGNPTKKNHKVIRVIVIKRDGEIHYSSGLYKILDIRDTIESGNFTTTMNLIRNSHPAAGVGGDPGIGTING